MLRFWVRQTIFKQINIGWPPQPPTEKVLKLILLTFQNIKMKLNSRTWMTLKSSVVIFQASEPLQPLDLISLCNWPLPPQKPYFIKKHPDCCIIPSNKMTNTDPFLWNGSTKSNFSLLSDTLSVGLLRPADVTFLKNCCGTQKFPISAFQIIFKPNLTCISLSVRANS